ncbi:MAG: hypothetical protein WCS42_13830 [Verrucomicrobiota bacterium]
MQIANGTVILSPENHQFKYGLTPAEALILFKLHFQNSNGTPLGDLFIQDGEALTVDAEAKPGEEAYFNQNAGKHIEAKAAVPAVTHVRTQAEEVERLKRRYTGIISGKPAFEAVFGSTLGVRLPDTFADIAGIVGKHFHKQTEEVAHSAEKLRTLALSAKTRPELCEVAISHKLKIHATDSKDYVIAAIINAENKQSVSAQE